MILLGTSQNRAFGVEGTSTQTSCVNNQPCQTMVCSEGQPCKVSETPNTDFDFEFDKDEPVVSQPLEGTGTGIAGLAPFYDPYSYKKNNRCAACYREAVATGKKYCIYHSQAYDSLQKQYDAWVHAYGGISKVDYMNKLLTLSQTGSWVKEVINEELKKEPKNTSK